MKKLLVILIVGAALAAANSASAAATRTHLWTAMHSYAACRAAAGSKLAGDLSSAVINGPVVFDTVMTNKAALVVRAGEGRHVVEWITSHGVVERLFTFRRLRNVAARLKAAC